MKRSFNILVFLLPLLAAGQELPRRTFMGVMMDTVSGETRQANKLSPSKGVFIKSVVPGSSAEDAGILSGDILLSINGKEVNSPAEGVKLVGTFKGGDVMKYELVRKGKTIKGESKFKTFPYESYSNIAMRYPSVKTVNGEQRFIVSQPVNQKKKMPAVVFIGGYGCYSLDTPFDTSRSETQLLNRLTREGYVCVRAEKPGVGDNTKCTPCNEVGLVDEMLGYLEVVKTVKKYDYVDSNSVYIIGHSMGGVIGPMVAEKTNIKGIIAYGTIGSNYIEYLLKTRRTIGEAYGWKQSETNKYVKDACECAAYYFVEKMKTSEAVAKNEICKDHLPVFDLRSRRYNNEMYNLNFASLWEKYEGKALLLWGEADYVAAKEDHEILLKAINEAHPGHGEFKTVKRSNHGMEEAANFQQARTSPGKYNPEVTGIILKWLNSVS
jgi:pimeloyl-ACP methyl ester carboxylesterase